MARFWSSAAYRIAVAYAAVFAWTILILGGTVFFVAHSEFNRQRDKEIATELDRLSREPNAVELRREIQWREAQEQAGEFRYALFDSDGKRTAGMLDISVPAVDLNDLPVRGDDGKDHLVRVGAVDLDNGSRMVVAKDADSYDRVDMMVLKLFLAAFLVLLAINAMGGVMLAWYLRNRLKPIMATANTIGSGDLAWRVPVSNRGDEFDAAGLTINLMLDRVAGLMENLRQVSSDIAHDLRKPLIRLLCQTDRLGQEGAEQRVFDLGDEMLELFAAILRIAEVEGGDLERSFARVDLSKLIGEVAESFEPALDDAGDAMDWTIEPDIAIMGNRELLAQLTANLLDNARIHTPAGTHVRITLASEGNGTRLVVEDNGPGVSEEDRPKLLQRFFRAETSRTTPGNGLGLNLVAAAAHAHHGMIELEDAQPGLRIVVKLPRLIDKAPVEEPAETRRPGFFTRWFQ